MNRQTGGRVRFVMRPIKMARQKHQKNFKMATTLYHVLLKTNEYTNYKKIVFVHLHEQLGLCVSAYFNTQSVHPTVLP